MKLPYQFNAVVKSRLAQLLGSGVPGARGMLHLRGWRSQEPGELYRTASGRVGQKG